MQNNNIKNKRLIQIIKIYQLHIYVKNKLRFIMDNIYGFFRVYVKKINYILKLFSCILLRFMN